MTLIKKFAQKLALGVACTMMGAAAHATPFAVMIALYGEEEPPLTNFRLALDLVNANGLSDSSVRIWSSLPVSSRVGGVTTVGSGSEYRIDDRTGGASLQFAASTRAIHFSMDWAGLSDYAAGAQAYDKLTLKLFDDHGRSFVPTSDTSGNNFLAIFTSQGMENFSTSFVEIDAQIPGGGPFPGPVNVPEPGSLGMIALGMSTLALFTRRRRSPPPR